MDYFLSVLGVIELKEFLFSDSWVSEFSGQAIICSQFHTTICVLTHYFNIHYNKVTDI